jgi:hypothetical protein
MPVRRTSRSGVPFGIASCLASLVLAGWSLASSPHPDRPTPALSSPEAGPAARQTSLPSATQTASPPLSDVLTKAAAYCRKLEGAAFDFVCREEIRETINPKYDVAVQGNPRDAGSTTAVADGTSPFLGPSIVISRVRPVKHSFVYDYQCIRAGRAIRELRTQLEENGKKKVRENAKLQTSVVIYGTALLAPVGLFAERFQPDFNYKVVGAETIGKTAALVLDASPKPGAPSSRNLYGQAWIDPATGNILKIEWSESRVGNFDVFQKRGEKYKRTPRLTIRSEFSAERNGIRFPSRLFIEEAYLNDKGKAFVRSKTEVVYKDFKFFTVEFEVRDRLDHPAERTSP